MSFAIVDDVFDEFLADSPQPGAVWGVVERGELVHVSARGHLWKGGPKPDADSVFRIASMTKSFTATCLLRLRDDGLLALDDPAEAYVPVLRGRTTPTSDARPVTVRELLTMSAGLPTDDAWGDRQLPITPERLDEIVAAGLRHAWAPGTAFEYSNLGYALLGQPRRSMLVSTTVSSSSWASSPSRMEQWSPRLKATTPEMFFVHHACGR